MAEDSKRLLGNYELIRRISDGAQASVYEARHLVDNETVALKLFKEAGDDDSAELRFKREAEILRKITHRNIVRYRDSFTTDSEWQERQNCLVMEFLKGDTLKEYLKDFPKGMPWEQAKDIFEQCLAGLMHASEKHGITHRDIKPSNIFLLEDGQVRLFDFGIARLEGGTTKTGGGPCMGSFDYMAPDFALSDELGQQGDTTFRGDNISDIFSLTVCFYEMLTGRVPWRRFGERPELEYLARWRTADKKPPAHSPIIFRVIRHLTGFIDKGLHPDRSGRFQSFDEMLEAMRELRPRTLSHKGKDDYELLEGLDKGGFGEVYKARTIKDQKVVAIKRLFTDRPSKRFVKEAEILKRYSHKHLVEYVDFFQNVSATGGKQLFLVMEYLEGMPDWSLRNRIRDSEYGLDISEVLNLFRNYLEALQYLHENVNPIIHRDIKPGNLYAPVDKPHLAKILDLGVARDVSGTQTHGATPGTWDYMAPDFVTEGFRGSPQSDIYALSLAMYEALTGSTAFPRASNTGQEAAAEFIARATGAKSTGLDFSLQIFKKHPFLEKIVHKGSNHDPAKRFASAAEMHKAITLVMQNMKLLADQAHGDGAEVDATKAEDQTAATRAETLATMFADDQESGYEWKAWVSREKVRRGIRRGLLGALAVILSSASAWILGSRLPERPATISAVPPPSTPSLDSPATITDVPDAVAPASTPPETPRPPDPAPSTVPDPGPLNSQRMELLRSLTRDLRLLRMRSIVGTSYQAFFDDAAARVENARLIASQPEYEPVRNSMSVKEEAKRLWRHIAENAVSRYQSTKDGHFLSAARGALHASASLYTDTKNASQFATVLREWRLSSSDIDFTKFLPIPVTDMFHVTTDPAGAAVLNPYLSSLLETPDFVESVAVMLPHSITAQLNVELARGQEREGELILLLVPESRTEIGDVPGPLYMAREEVTFGAMRCYRDSAAADLRDKPELKTFYSGRMDTRTVRNNDVPYEIDNTSEAFEFCNWLSIKNGFKPVYRKSSGTGSWTADLAADGFRLPTTPEWEYAAQLGFDSHVEPTRTPWKDMSAILNADHPDDLVWFYYKDQPRPASAGPLTPYPLGMVDMCGNLAELAMAGVDMADTTPATPQLFLCGGSYKNRTAGKVMPWSKEAFVSSENAGFRVVLPVRTAYFVR